ncbi:phage minor tail protein G [Salmonella enterica subsp. enterica serovar Bredeney]|nr:phage minor tail protein G [Salmonella enterica subsp. enterica serovar Bredeney]
MEYPMFLKNEPFEQNGQSITLYELSALQRIEYLEYLAAQTRQFQSAPDDADEMARLAFFSRRQADVNAWLISRSLWHADTTRNVDEVQAEILRSWSLDALSGGAAKVTELSGMKPDIPADDEKHEPLSPEKLSGQN